MGENDLRLVSAVPCGNCKGKARVFSPTFQIGDGAMIRGTKCPTCDGRGTIEDPVSCAGCRHYNPGWYCAKHQAFEIQPTHGCLSWQPREEQS